MKNIIPFKKDVIFKTNLSEITSISLENTLNIKSDVVSGDFIINGEYKMNDNSATTEPFEIKLPFEICIDERFDSNDAIVDIDDFYYEIKNNNVLSVSIDVLLDHLKERPPVEIEDIVDVTPVRQVIEDNNTECINESKASELETDSRENIEEKINSIFNSSSFDKEVYVTYNVFIVRDGDSIDSIIEKYNTTVEELKKYNDISNLQIGDKLIIPTKLDYEGN
ncbi:MAG: LysM domain-containing protein [bacterium]|nr:LysM domain-containing protein [bacterium]